MTTETETAQVLEMLGSGRQKLDAIDVMAFPEVIADHTLGNVVRAMTQVRKAQPFIDPSSLRAELETDGSDDVWPAIADLITSGALRTHLNPAEFPSDRAYRAARKIVPQLISGTPHGNAKAFREAYKRTPLEAPTPAHEIEAARVAELEASSPNVVGLDQRRKLAAAARAAIPARTIEPA